MGFMNKSEVKKQLSAYEHSSRQQYRPVCPSDASGFLGQKHRSPVTEFLPLSPSVTIGTPTFSKNRDGLRPFLAPALSQIASK